MRSLISCFCLASISVLGCSSDTTEIGSVHVKSELIKASEGGSIEVLSADVPEHPDLVGAKIEIPAGALGADTTITIGLEDSNIPTGATSAGPVIDFGPNGTTFSAPAIVTLPYDGTTGVDLIRIYVREASGKRSVIMPTSIVLDSASKRLRFTVTHFTSFQPGSAANACADVADCMSNQCEAGRCVDPNACDPQLCGPAPGLASFLCEDGSIGGFTGRCEQAPDGSCGWVINDCPPSMNGCDPANCGPAPGVPTYQCPDGRIGGFTGECLPDASGQCAWRIEECGIACMADSNCDPNAACVNGICQPGTPPPCNASGQCGPGEFCDPMIGRCIPSCANGDPNCAECNASSDCGPNQVCVMGFCQYDVPVCDPNDCGPAPGLPSYVCVDGSIGGFTGRCLPSPDGRCGWEIRACDPSEPCFDPNGNLTCPAGEVCDPETNRCLPASCGNQVMCPACNADSDCGPMEQCLNGLCTSGPGICDPASCGPPLGAPAYTCEDGSLGGNTGRCLPSADGQCGWEFISCPAAHPCDPNRGCEAGYVCANGLCLLGMNGPVPCMTNADCGPNQVCSAGVCGP